MSNATKAEARNLHRHLIAEIETNRLAPAREETLEQYSMWWLHTVKANQVLYSTAGDYEDRLRRGEILGLKWSDFNLNNATLIVARTLKEERRFNRSGTATVKVIADKTKTRAAERTLQTGLSVLIAMQRHKEHIARIKADAGTRWQESDWVFPSTTGTALAPSNVYRRSWV